MDLCEQHCQQEIPATLLSDIQIKQFLTEIPGWKILVKENNNKYLTRSVKFKNYEQTLKFINTIAKIIQAEDHHPDICFGYNQCEIAFMTHSAGGITTYDFICAAHIEKIISQQTSINE